MTTVFASNFDLKERLISDDIRCGTWFVTFNYELGAPVYLGMALSPIEECVRPGVSILSIAPSRRRVFYTATFSGLHPKPKHRMVFTDYLGLEPYESSLMSTENRTFRLPREINPLNFLELSQLKPVGWASPAL